MSSRSSPRGSLIRQLNAVTAGATARLSQVTRGERGDRCRVEAPAHQYRDAVETFEAAPDTGVEENRELFDVVFPVRALDARFEARPGEPPAPELPRLEDDHLSREERGDLVEKRPGSRELLESEELGETQGGDSAGGVCLGERLDFVDRGGEAPPSERVSELTIAHAVAGDQGEVLFGVVESHGESARQTVEEGFAFFAIAPEESRCGFAGRLTFRNFTWRLEQIVEPAPEPDGGICCWVGLAERVDGLAQASGL